MEIVQLELEAETALEEELESLQATMDYQTLEAVVVELVEQEARPLEEEMVGQELFLFAIL